MKTYLQQVEDFKNKQSNKQKIIVIYGPTGSGKTNMSIEVAKFLNTEIISTDSRQIFKYMDIGTGKITEEEKKGVIHHMIDIIEPNVDYSVGEFKSESEKSIQNLHSKGKIPMLVGGTGLYIDSLIYDFDIPGVPADDKLRDKLESEAKLNGNEFIFKKLQKLDPDYDKNLHTNNLRYVIRALEVKILTGKSKTSFKKEKKLKYDTLFLTPDYGTREDLYARINRREKQIVESGLLKEVKGLLGMGYKENDFGMKSIGYSEFFPYFNGEINLEQVTSQIQQNARNYAKRQITWFKKYNNNKSI